MLAILFVNGDRRACKGLTCTINNILFTEGYLLARDQSTGPFKSSNGTEGVGGVTFSLVLHWRDHVVASPVQVAGVLTEDCLEGFCIGFGAVDSYGSEIGFFPFLFRLV